MELTGLKHAINTGAIKKGNSLNNTESNSRTLGNKLIKNARLPKFLNGAISTSNVAGLQYSFSAPTLLNQISPNNINISSSDNLSAIQKFNIAGGGTGLYNNYTKNIIGQVPVNLNTPGGLNKDSGIGKSSGAGIGSVNGIVSSGILFAGDAINAFSVNESAEEIAARQGTSSMSIGGVAYDSPNTINISDEIDSVKKENAGNMLKTVGSGAALGTAILPGWGTAIGTIVGLGIGLFGGESRKRRYRQMIAKQNAKINALQDSSRFSAQTKAMQLSNAREYGNSEALYLYGAAEGKLPKYSDGVDTSFIKLPVYSQTGKPTFSAFGPTNAEPNAKVSSGEEIVNADTGFAYRIPGKKNNKDTEYAYLNPRDMVVTNKDGLSDYYAMTGDYEGTREMLKNRLEMAKNGRLPKFDDGFISPWKMMQENVKKSSQNNINRWKNTIALPELLGFGGYVDPYSINPNLNPPYSEYNNYTNEGGTGKWFTSPLDNLPYYFNMASALGHSLFRDRRIFAPKTGIAAPQGLERLDALRMNPYPILINNRAAEARTNRAIDMSGGLNAAQRNLARLAAQYNTQLNDAQALANMQIQNNQYISDAVKTRLAAESAYDQRVVAQNNLRDDIFMRGHGDNQKMDIDDLTTASTAWLQANKNIFNRNIYRWMMDQYALENKANRKNRRWII